MASQTVYAVASGKGGVGKTTTTVNVGTALAGAGNSVAVVDADMGMANLAGLVSLSPDATTLHEVLAGEASVEAATYELADGIVAVPSGADLESYADVDATGLADVVDRLREEFDYVLLDVGAGISHESVLPLGLADEVVLVTTPEPASVQDASKTADLTERADGRVAGLVITRVRDDRNFDFEGIAERVGVPLLGTVPEDDAVRDSVYSGTPVIVDAPESPAAAAYRRLAERLGDDEGTGAADEADGGVTSASDEDGADADTASHTEVSSAIPGDGGGDTGNRAADSEAATGDDPHAADPDAPSAVDAATDDDEDDEPTKPESADTAADDTEGESDSGDPGGEPSADPDGESADPDGDEDSDDDGGVTIPDAEGDDGTNASETGEDDGISFDEDGAVPFSDRDTPGGEDEDPSDDADDEADEDDDGGFLGRIL